MNIPRTISVRILPSACRLLSALLLSALVAASGCSRSDYSGAVAAINSNNIQKLGNFYAAFQSSRMGQGPKDESELKSFIQLQTSDTLKLMRIDPNSRDAIWTSERDHKPFKVRYGVNSPFGALAAVVFEQDGVDGKRQVAFNNSKFEDVDEAHYKELWQGKGGPSKPVSTGAPAPGLSPDMAIKK